MRTLLEAYRPVNVEDSFWKTDVSMVKIRVVVA